MTTPSYDIKYTGFPPIFLNAYIIGQLENYNILTGYEQMSPIFPTSPTNIEDMFKNYIGSPGVDDPLLIQYEKLVRFRTTPFYRNKKEQLIYYMYSTNLSKVMNSYRIISDALDREDAAAQDVNAWLIREYQNIESNATYSSNLRGIPNTVFFHNIKVYQADETRDVMELVSARTVYVNKLIIEYDYHTKDKYVDGVNVNPYT